ncbi:MAG: lytic transglycosylase domain-containing protein [Parcubacteria group bacterium]|nr:lytic transglycosylase domain-containing protein [Parcubacteria group bacterium]
MGKYILFIRQHFIPLLFILFWVSGTFLITHCSRESQRVDRTKKRNEAVRDSLTTLVDSLLKEMASIKKELYAMNNVYMPDTVLWCGQIVPLDPVSHWYIRNKLEETLRFYAGYRSRRQRITTYLIRSEIYFPYLDSMLTLHRLPNDLKYIPIIESEFNQRAKSFAKAEGPWQFIAPTGQEFGLIISPYIDERRNFERSTEKALVYLAEMYDGKYVQEGDSSKLVAYGFHDWFLTVAAYNAGARRIKKSFPDTSAAKDSVWFSSTAKKIKMSKPTKEDSSYFNLDLPDETAVYVYRAIAIKIIMEHPEKFDFKRRPYEGVEMATIEYSTKRKKELWRVAREFKTPLKEFEELNAQFDKIVLPGSYLLIVPKQRLKGIILSDSAKINLKWEFKINRVK